MTRLQVVDSLNDSRLYAITGREIPGIRRYVATTPETRLLACEATLCGVPYTQELEKGLAKTFLMLPEVFDHIDDSQVNILNVLTGSDAWHVREALQQAKEVEFPKESYLWTKRHRRSELPFMSRLTNWRPGRSGWDKEWYIEHRNEKIRAGKQDTVVIADIVATGVSLDYALKRVAEIYARTDASVEQLVVVTLGGEETERRLAENLNLFDSPSFKGGTIVYLEGRFTIANQAMGLRIAESGTDLILPRSLLAPEFVLEDLESLEYTLERCRAYYGSTRHADPRVHLAEVGAYWRQLQSLAAQGLTLGEAIDERSLLKSNQDNTGFLEDSWRVNRDSELKSALEQAFYWRNEELHDISLESICEKRIAELEFLSKELEPFGQ